MTEDVRRLLAESSQNTLETMFFVTPDQIGEELDMPPGPQIAASLTFEGAAAGCFDMQISLLAAQSIAANFLGTDESAGLAPEQVSDAMGELANMTCGATLSRLSTNAAFDLSAPITTFSVGGNADRVAQPQSGAALHLALPEGAIVVSLAFGAQA